ncbi:MAG: hypothetical protein JJE55_08090 [Flavobacteriaceae bacterium]|nr:hypothetical protein [Flavobacteriaceae bacterium]
MSEIANKPETPKTDRRKLWSFFDPKINKHMYILSLCIQYGWSKTHPRTGREVADLGKLDRWLRGKRKSGQSPVKKPLKEMEKGELSQVITALENMVLKANSK